MNSIIKLATGSGVAMAGAAGGGPAGGAAGGATVSMVDGGGPVITTPDIYLIFWGSSWAGSPTPSAAAVTAAFDNILMGPYMSALLQYRGVGHGMILGQTSVTNSNPPAVFTNPNVTAIIQGLLDNGTLPEPDQDARILYVVVLPPGVQFTNSLAATTPSSPIAMAIIRPTAARPTSPGSPTGVPSIPSPHSSPMNWRRPAPTPRAPPFRSLPSTATTGTKLEIRAVDVKASTRA